MPFINQLSAFRLQLSDEHNFLLDKKLKKSDDCRLKTDNYSKGFTLIELLIAISIIAIVAVAGIPNLRLFNQGQDIDSAAGDLVTSLRTVQSNDMSGIKCTKSSTYPNPTGWSVILTQTANPTTYGYKITQDCSNDAGAIDPDPLVYTSKTFPSNIKLAFSPDGTDIDFPSGCTSINNNKLSFVKNTLVATCPGVSGSLTATSFFGIRVSSTTTDKVKTVRVYKGGSIGVR